MSKARRTPTILDAIADKHLFAPWFRDKKTWEAWFTVITALFGLPLTEDQLANYQQCTGRAVAPTSPLTEAWLICGRRSGKSFMLALIAVYLATFRDWRPYLAPAERATVLVVSVDRRQARVILRFIRGMLTGIPMLARMIERETADSFDLSNSVAIEVATASFRTTRGYAICACCLDELAFFRTDDAAEPDYEILSAIRPGMAQFPNAMLLCASSPYAKKGALHDAFKRHYGKDGDVLVWKAPTKVMNSTVPQSIIDAAMERDPASAAAEWMAEFRSDLEDYISRETVIQCVDVGVYERSPIPTTRYVSFVDVSGGSVDSTCCAVGHLEGDLIVVDALREIKAPHDPESATEELAQFLASFKVSETTGDRYSAQWCAQAFEKRRIRYKHSELNKSQLYVELLPRLNAKTIRLLDHPRAINQICGLERHTTRGGRDSIDHPSGSGSHDDVANVLANLAVVLASSKSSYDDSLKWVGGPSIEEQRFGRLVHNPWSGMHFIS
jgi:hypothetical protein